MRVLLSLLVVLGVVAVGPPAVVGRALVPASDLPWVLDGQVHALAVADGKLFVGGEFKQVAAPTGPLVAFTHAGQHDATFPAADLHSGVAVAIGDGQGGLYLGGSFKTLGGVACRSLAHISRGGTVDRGFCPRPDGPVASLALAGSRLYVGGEFNRIAGAERKRLAALDLRTGHATAFRLANPPFSIWQLEATPGAIYALGEATFLALDPGSGKRLAYAPNADVTVHGDSVAGFALAGSRVYAWGAFGRIGGKSCGGLAVVDARSGRAIGCRPRISVDSGVVSDGVLFVGGSFNSVDGKSRAGLAAFAADTGRLLPWKARGLPVGVETLTVADNVLYAAGPASAHSDAASVVAARSVRTGAAVRFSAPQFNGGVRTIAPLGEKVVVGGGFDSLGGTTHADLLAVDVASGRPLPWQAGIPDAAVSQLSVVGSTVYVAGFFDRAGGRARNDFAAFDARSGAILPWRPQLDYADGFVATADAVYTATREQLFALDPRTGALVQTLRMPDGTGALAASGDVVFDASSPNPKTSLVALETNPLRVAAKLGFTIPAAPYSQTLAAHGSSVYLGGAYTQLAGVKQRYLARLSYENGSFRVDAWRPRVPGPVLALSLGGDTVVAAGLTTDGARWYVALVDSASGKSTTLGYGPADDGFESVQAVALSGHVVYVGGTFGLQRFHS